MKLLHILFSILCSTAFLFSQTDSLEFDTGAQDRYVAWLIPSAAKNIYGLAIGPVGSESLCNIPYTSYSHGLNVQLPGQGFILTSKINKLKFKDPNEHENLEISDLNETIPRRAVHKGLIMSPFGTLTDQVNGISFSAWMSGGKQINGLSLNLLSNFYEQVNGISIGLLNQAAMTRGMQIGLVNNSLALRGFQFGIWNKNEKRSLPILNWNFSDKKLE